MVSQCVAGFVLYVRVLTRLTTYSPARAELQDLDSSPSPHSRTTHSRSNEYASEFLRQFFHHTIHAPLTPSGQRRHASAMSRESEGSSSHRSASVSSPARTSATPF